MQPAPAPAQAATALAMKYGYPRSACFLILWHDFLDHLDGVVAKQQARDGRSKGDDGAYGASLSANGHRRAPSPQPTASPHSVDGAGDGAPISVFAAAPPCEHSPLALALAAHSAQAAQPEIPSAARDTQRSQR